MDNDQNNAQATEYQQPATSQPQGQADSSAAHSQPANPSGQDGVSGSGASSESLVASEMNAGQGGIGNDLGATENREADPKNLKK